MRRKREEFDRTVGEVQALFERLVGPGYDNSFAQRVLRIPVDGAPLGRRRAERQKARSVFYAKEHIEAQEVANMLVQLELDVHVANVVRRDKPDIEVHWHDRPSVYIEHRIVAEPGMTFERHLEEAQHAFEDLAQNDPMLLDFLKAGTFTVRLSDPGLKARTTSGRGIATEAARLAGEIRGPVSLLKPDPERYSILARYAAKVFYKVGGPEQSPIFQPYGGTINPRPQWVPEQLGVALTEKKAAVAGYDLSCRPLWLLLSLQHEGLFQVMLREVVEATLLVADTGPFERIIVRAPLMKPVVVDSRARFAE